MFDLSLSVYLYQSSQVEHHESVVAGRKTGLLKLGETVTWEATHFGIRQRLTSRIVQLSRPDHFRDSMVAGAFTRFDHDHYFDLAANDTTRLRDVFDYTAPLGAIGRIADALFLRRYMRALLIERNIELKKVAESNRYDAFLSGG